MQIELKVPAVGESITEVEIGNWLKKEGDSVQKDENIVVLESEKTTLELPSPAAGKLGKLLKTKGQVAAIGEVIGFLVQDGAAAKGEDAKKETGAGRDLEKKTDPAKVATEQKVMPAAARALAEQGLKPDQVTGSGPGGRVLKEDVAKAAEQTASARPSVSSPASAPTSPVPPTGSPTPPSPGALHPAEMATPSRQEQVVPMTRLRKTLAERLVQAQQNAALLTTFNEVDMSGVMALRKEYQDSFTAKYGIKLGFMSFFVKAVVDGLRLIPEVNSEIRGTDIIYRNYQDIGVAVGGGKGLVVPVIRNAERLSFAQIELTIADFAKRAKENKLKLEELQGGTFTISNGGIYGSLLSTPIVNPPQSGILGMHSIQERPIAVNGQVVIRPMMYIALSYDHRVVDGREAVTFLKRVKEVIENPTRMLLEV
jgi:2-oxoglutarate dehydrogenase E2 component (dihydrolipoamide succinyltransferase)